VSFPAPRPPLAAATPARGTARGSSAALEFAAALFEERRQRFLVVFRFVAQRLEGRAHVEMLGERLGLRELEQALGIAYGKRRFGRDLAGKFARARNQRVRF